MSRDGVWNTNNYIESAFRVFDVAFLELKKNKRYVDISGSGTLDQTLTRP